MISLLLMQKFVAEFNLGHVPDISGGVPDGFQNDIMKNIMQTRLQHKLSNMSE